jgi:hypothetical protein
MLGLAIYALAHYYLIDSLPAASLDGSLTSEVLSDWWRTASSDLSSHITKLALIAVVYLLGYWYWLSKYLQDISSTSAAWAWMRLALLGVLQLVLTLILIAAPCLLVVIALGDPTQAVSERPFILGVTGASIVGTALAVAIGVPLVRTKYLLSSTDIRLWAAIKDGYTYSLAHSSRHQIVIVTAMVLSIVLWWVSSKVPSINGHSTGLVLLVAILYQAVMIARSLVRAWTIYSLAYEQDRTMTATH